MLRQYQIKNFKAFADTDLLPIRPITLIYGRNSAGKSSIIQSLMLLKQTLDEVNDDDTVLLPKGKLVDLGNYREFIHLHEINRKFSVRFQLEINLDNVKSPESIGEMPDTVSRIYKSLYRKIIESPVLSLEIKFSVGSVKSTISLSQVDVWIGDDDSPVITYKKNNQKLKVSKLHPQHSFWQAWWREYDLIFSSKVFNQINKILDKYGISRLNKRDQGNVNRRLEGILSFILEEKERVDKSLNDINSDIISSTSQKNELERNLSRLRNQQNTSEKELEESQITLKSEIISVLIQDFQNKFDHFLVSSTSVDSFFEQLGLNNQMVNEEIKPKIKEQRLQYKNSESTQKKESSGSQEKKEIENLRQRIKNILEDEINNCIKINKFPVNLDQKGKERFTKHQKLKLDLDDLRASHSEERKPLEEEISRIQERLDILKREYTKVPAQDIYNATQNVDSLASSLEDFKQKQLEKQFDDKIEIVDFLKSFWQKLDDYTIELALEDFLKLFCNSKIIHSNFLLIDEELTDSESNPQIYVPEYALDFLSGIYDDAQPAKFLLETSFYSSSLLQDFLGEMVCIGPMRDYPERFYIFSGNSTKQVGRSGTSTSDLLFRDPQLLQQVNDRIKEFEIGYQIKVISFQDQGSDAESDVYAIRLIDDQLEVDVSLLDVGFGVSQILPVIVQSMSSSDQTILLEQPEVHVHPRLQTKLGDLLIYSAQQLRNKFIVETHSEHLMLRLQRRIREGRLDKDDVSVIYVDPDKEGAKCIQLRLNSKGKFIDKWPHGFFDEDIEEIFG